MQPPLRLLLADDEVSLREPLAKHLIQTCGYHVDTASNAQDLQILLEKQQGRYEVVLIDDLLMPAPNQEPEPLGVVLTQAIKSRYEDIQVIVFTGWGMKSGIDALRAGAYRYLSKPFNLDELGMLIQTAAEHGRLKSVIREKQILVHLMETSTALISGQSLSEVLQTILHGVQAIGFDRICLYLLTDDRQTMIGQAQVGLTSNFVGHQRLVATDEQMQLLLADPRPHIFQRKDAAEPLPYEQELAREGVFQWACIPLMLQGAVIGKLSIDNKFSQRPILESELDPVALFASQAAAAIHNARLRDKERKATAEAERRARNLEAMRQTALAISFQLDRKTLLQTIIQQAVALLEARSGGVYEYFPERGELVGVVDYGRPEEVLGNTLAVGEGMAGRLVQNGEPFMVIPDYDSWPGKAAVYAGKRPFGAVIEVPLRWQERIMGILYVDDEVGREFSSEEANLLRLFADHAGIALANAELVAQLNEQKDRLTQLVEMTDRRGQLLAALDEASRHIRAEKETFKLVQEIVRLAAELVGCTAGGLCVYRPQLQELELTVTYELSSQLIGSFLPHTEGLLGLVARTGQPQISQDYLNWPDREYIFEACNFRTIVGLPLKQAGEVEAVLFVADQTDLRQVRQTDLEILERFAVQAAIALQTSRLLTQEQRALGPLAILHKISDYIQAAGDLDKILHAVLTGVTAGYGLGFNRAALLFLDERRRNLIGRMGIGHLDEAQTRQDWRCDQQRGLYDFGRYLDFLKQEAFPLTSVGQRITGLELPLGSSDSDLFSRVVWERRPILITSEELADLPRPFCQAFEPALPFVAVPLIARDQVIALLVADNKFTQSPITQGDIGSLMTYANTAAIAIDNIRLLQQTKVAQERLSSLFVASNALVSSQDPKQVLQDIVEQVRTAAQARGVSMYLIDETGQVQSLMALGTDESFDLRDVMIRPDGLSKQVMQTGEPEIIEDVNIRRERVNPSMFSRGIAAALCLPVSLEGKRIGVMWIHYGQPHFFSKPEIEALQLYVNQAAIAYDSARRIKELEYLRQAAESLAQVTELAEVLEQIVQSAREVLRADSTVIWSYDAVRDRLVLERSVAAGLTTEWWKEFQKVEPRPGGTAYTVMEQGWLGVTNVDDLEQFGFLGESTRKILGEIGAHSFQSIALTVGEEKLGVLYANYHHSRSFSKEEQETARTFANHAALTLKKARLLEQVSKARNTAKVVAAVTALEDVNATLHSVAEGIQDALGCDSIVLYGYDQPKDRLTEPPIMVGVRHHEWLPPFSGLSTNPSIVFEILKREQPYIVEDMATDPLFQDRPFARKEQILSCMAIPLKVGLEKVGVIFINYRLRHRFTTDELTNIELFANQAAVAIRNAQLYDQVQKRAGALQALYEAGRAMTGSLDLGEILNRIVEHAPRVTKYQSEQINLACLRLIEDTKSWIAAAYPPDQWARVQEVCGLEVDLRTGINGRIGIMGRAAKTGEPQLVGNVTVDPDYFMCHPETRSELAVPIKLEDKVIGVVNVEHADYYAFGAQDQQALQSLAVQASIAIQNARLFIETQRKAQLLDAAARVARDATAFLDINQLLTESARLICDCFGFYHTGIFLLDEKREYAILQAAYPKDGHGMLKRGHRLKVGWDGIVGFVTQSGTPHLALNVSKDPYHLANSELPLTRSEMTFPLIARGQVIGALDAQSKDVVNLADEDVATLQIMADQLANAIHNAQQYDELKRTKGLVGARTALAWMGMVSSVWRHAIDGHALTIQEEAELLQGDLDRNELGKVSKRVKKVRQLAHRIFDKPITPPLSDEEGVSSVYLNSLIRERVKQLWENEPYALTQIQLDLNLDEATTVRASPQWLQHIFDVLIDNAIDSMKTVTKPRLTISTTAIGDRVRIIFTDTGSGIPEPIQQYLLKVPIDKATGEKGMGMGLLMALTIAETYGGELRIGASGPHGTSMVVEMPIERQAP